MRFLTNRDGTGSSWERVRLLDGDMEEEEEEVGVDEEGEEASVVRCHRMIDRARVRWAVHSSGVMAAQPSIHSRGCV